jgi:hypothetical protein
MFLPLLRFSEEDRFIENFLLGEALVEEAIAVEFLPAFRAELLVILNFLF